jgi:RNA polymerase sigma-70 factor (ECF subfamily)
MNVAKGDCRTPLGSSEASVKGALQRARVTPEARLPAGREHAPPPGSPRERQLAGRFAAAVETSDIDAVLDLLTSDTWLTMPPEPYEYQGRAAIARFLHHRASLRGAPLRLAPTRANPQPAFGCYRPCPQAPIARPYGMIVLTLEDDRICAITWFSDSSVFPLRTAAHTAQMTCGVPAPVPPQAPLSV